MTKQVIRYINNPVSVTKWNESIVCAEPTPVDWKLFLRLSTKEKLQRLAYNFLKRTGWIQSKREKVVNLEFESVEIDTSDLARQVLQHFDHIYCTYGIEADTLFVGRKVQQVLHATVDPYTSFPVIMSNGERYDSYFAGMKIVLVPWLDGFFLWSDKFIRMQ